MAPRTRPLHERFWEKVDVRGPDECWPWVSPHVDADGYGRIRTGSRSDNTRRLERSNRVAFRLANGFEATGLVCHTCDNPLCCNPTHLYDGTPQTNMRDMADRERSPKRQQTRCSEGHEFTPENTIIRPNKTRGCRTCHNARRNKGVGQGVKQRKLTVEQAIEVKRLLSLKTPRKEIANRFGISVHNVTAISTGKTWRSI